MEKRQEREGGQEEGRTDGIEWLVEIGVSGEGKRVLCHHEIGVSFPRPVTPLDQAMAALSNDSESGRLVACLVAWWPGLARWLWRGLAAC